MILDVLLQHWMSYLNGFEDAVVEVREARVLVHHAMDQLSELQQEGFAGGKPIVLQRLHQRYHMGNDLIYQIVLISFI